MKVNQTLLSTPKDPATAASQAAEAATRTATTTAAAATTIAGSDVVVSASGSGSCTDTDLAEHKRYHTGGQLQQQQQQQQQRNYNNSNGPGNNWHQMKSTKYNAKPWLNGHRSYPLKNSWNNCNPNFNYMQNTPRDSCQNQNNNNNNNRHSYRNNLETFNERSRQNQQRWLPRDHQDRSNYSRCSTRFNSFRDEVRRESSRRGGEEHRDKEKQTSETSEQEDKPKQQTQSKAYKARVEEQAKSEKQITNPQEAKEEREKKTKTKEDGQEVVAERPNRPTTSRGLRSTSSCSPLKSLEGEKRKPPAKPSEVQCKPSKSSSEKEQQAVSLHTYPQIQVRPLTELLKQEILAVTQEKRAAKAAPSSNGGVVQLTQRSATHLRRRTYCSHGEASINDRLANMHKEGLKYIINNSDTIYNEHLKQQARRRLREEIRRQLKEIELEQPKDQPAKALVEDEIVDAIKLPQILLQEIEKCFGISVQEKQGEQEEQRQAQLEQQQVEQEQQEQVQQEQGQQQVHQEQQQLHVEQEQQQVEQDLQQEVEQEQELVEQKPKINNEKEQPIPHMAKESSRDLTRRLKVADLSNKANITAATHTTQKQSVEGRKRQQEQKQIATMAQTNLLAIKKEIHKDSNSNSPIAYIVLSSSEDEEDDEKEEEQEKVVQKKVEQEVQKVVQKEMEQEKEELVAAADSDHSNSSRLKEDAEKVVDSFEKLLLPQLKESLAESYRSSHSTSLQSRLLFISCVVTNERNTRQTFSKMEVAKLQQNLKSSDNRLGIEFLQREIAKVVNQFKQREQEQQLERETAAANEPNELNLASSTDDKSAELAASYQRETDVAEQAASSSTRASLSPTTNITNATRSLHPALSLSVPYRSLDAAAAAAGLPNLSGLPPGCSSLESAAESLLLSSGDSVANSLLEIDRRLLENQNRRSFLEEMIMKFQKEKSDMEMASLELQNRKFLLLNAVIGRKQMAAAATTSSPLLTSTPTNSPPPQPPAASSPPAVSPPRRKLRPKRRTRFLPKRKPRKLRNSPAQQVNEAESKSSQTEEPLTSSTTTFTSKSISIPQPIKQEPSAPVEVAEPVQLNNENDATTKRASSESTGTASNKRQCLARTATTNASQQQPLAVIPPLKPPPPPPEPFAHMSYELPRILRKPTPPPAQVPSSPQSVGSQHCTESFNYGFIPSGRLHNIVSPITQICIHKVSIIAASENGDIYVFNIGSHKLEQQIPKHSEAITNMFLCKSNSFLYTTSLDGFLKKSSLENLERITQTVYLKEPLQSIDIAWGIAFIGSRWGNIFTYNIAANKVMETPLLSTGQSIIAVKATKEGARKIIMLGCKGNCVFLHDAATGLLLRRLSVPEGLNVYSLLLVDGFVFCGTQKNEVYKFDFASGALTNTLSCGNGAVAMATYRDRYLLIGCYDGFIYVLNKENGLRLGRFSGPGRLVLSLAIAGDKIVTSSKDNSLEVLEIPPEILCMDSET